MSGWYSPGPAVCVTQHAAETLGGLLTIRLPRYFSTSDKLRTDTLALGIIIPVGGLIGACGSSVQDRDEFTTQI